MAKQKHSLTDSKLVRILADFSPIELNRLEKFLRSPFFCTDARVVKLFEILREAYPDFQEEMLHKSFIARRLFGNEVIDYQKEKGFYPKLRLLCTYLLRLIYDYLTQIEMEKRPDLKRWLLLTAMDERDHLNDFGRLADQGRRHMNEIPFPEAEHYLFRYLQEEVSFQVDQTRLNPRFIDTALNDLDHFYMIKKLRLSCLALQLEGLSRRRFKLNTLSSMLSYSEEYPFSNFVPAIYANLFRCLMHLREEEYVLTKKTYRSCKKLLSQLLKELRSEWNPSHPWRETITELFRLSISITNRLARYGWAEYYHELLYLYNQMIEYDLLIYENQINPNEYKNIITLALRTGNVAWAENFLYQYQNYLPNPVKEDAFQYNFAHISLYQKDYRAVHRVLFQTQFIDPFYNLDARVIQLKAYYEAYEYGKDGSYEQMQDFFRACQNFLRYLKREKKVAKNQHPAYKQFIRFLQALFYIKSRERDNLDRVGEDLRETPFVIEKIWLVAKCEEQTHWR